MFLVGSLVFFTLLGDDKLNCRECNMPAFIIKFLASERVSVTRKVVNLSFCLGPVLIYTRCVPLATTWNSCSEGPQ